MSKNHFKAQIEDVLSQKVLKLTSLSNSHSSSQFIAQTEKNKYFVKTSSEATSLFQCEATGLKLLSQNYQYIPSLFSFSLNELIIEFIETEEPQDSYWIQLATELSKLHKTKKDFYGFFENNHIGLSTQNNLSDNDSKFHWSHFFWKHRILYKLNQLQEVRKFSLDSETQEKLKDSVLSKLDLFKSQPSLIHGDLWSGNILCGKGQLPYLIDPAISFSDREAEIAMTECFGGFSPLFYKTYSKLFPLEEGYDERKHIYNLYHMLNHFVIFGENYKQSCFEIIDLIIQS